METGRDINRDDWFPGTVDEFDGLTIGSGHYGGQPSTKEGIDEDVARGEKEPHLVGRQESNDRCSPGDPNEPTIHGRGIATQVGDRCEENHVNPSLSAVQQSSQNQPVSSVVPFSAEDGNGLASCWSAVLLQMPDNSLAGPLHQDGTGNMCFDDCAAIECLHLGSSHDLHRWPCVRDRYRMTNRVRTERKAICCLRRNVMTRTNGAVHGGTQGAAPVRWFNSATLSSP